MTGLVERLRAAGCVFAEDEARLLCDNARDGDDLDRMVGERVAGTPIEYVLGWAQFCGLRVAVERGVFVPRRRTEFLVSQAAALRPSVVVDLCCGTGAIGLALRERLGAVDVHAADVDPVAVRCARRNLGAQVYAGDLYDALPGSLRGRVDVLAVNAPYVPTAAIATMPPEAREHEPAVALDGGADGIDVQRRIVAGACDWLAADGHLLVETSTVQAAELAAVFGRHGLRPRIVGSDELGATVVIGARTPAAL
jgi:release factor glutamine methyltransferase